MIKIKTIYCTDSIKELLGLLLFLLFGIPLTLAQTININGFIRDADTGEDLSYVNIIVVDRDFGTTSNNYGFYSLAIDENKNCQLIFSYVGYQSDTIRLSAHADTSLNIYLTPSIVLSAVEVESSSPKQQLRSTQMSTLELLPNTIKSLPALLGEVDVIKAVQLLPGVQGGNEGFAGLYVRGGGPDQNLILLDGVPIYNANHALGIFSVFNADAIRDIRLIKGGFPARYGGRLSSVLEINTKEGNLNAVHGEGTISTIASKITMEGPIKKDKTSFLLSTRRSYIDLILNPLLSGNDLTTYFYDFNTKIRHKINDRHQLYFSLYTGADRLANVFEEEDGEEYGGGLDWKNLVSSIRWNYKLSNKLFSNFNLNYSRYDVDVNNYEKTTTTESSANYFSSIEDIGLSWNFDFAPLPQHAVKWGVNLIGHTYNPGALNLNVIANAEQIDSLLTTKKLHSFEYNAYLEDDFEIGNRLASNIGLHFSGFQVENEHYTSLQLRVGSRYQLKDDLSLKASFANMAQYINLLSNESLGLPTDLWVPSTARVKPQLAWQAAVGMAKSIKKGYALSLEAFYKQMDNVVSYQEGSQFLYQLEEDWQDKVTQGQGEAYGAELFLEKKLGKTSGWLGYTLSWNWRQFDDINGGRRYPFRYDRRHDLAIVVNHQRNDRVAYSFSWQYGTGNAISVPQFRYASGPIPTNPNVGIFSSDLERFVITERNGYRMSSFHRLDASVSFTKQKKHYTRKWIISIYNVYGHINPYLVRLDLDRGRPIIEGEEREREVQLKEVGLIPFVPSIAYSFKF